MLRIINYCLQWSTIFIIKLTIGMWCRKTLITLHLELQSKWCKYKVPFDSVEFHVLNVTWAYFFSPSHSRINNSNEFTIADKHTLIFLLRLPAMKNPFELLIQEWRVWKVLDIGLEVTSTTLPYGHLRLFRSLLYRHFCFILRIFT